MNAHLLLVTTPVLTLLAVLRASVEKDFNLIVMEGLVLVRSVFN